MYLLQLTEMELSTLKMVLGCVGGSPDTSLRKHMNSLVNKLPTTLHDELEHIDTMCLKGGEVLFKNGSIKKYQTLIEELTKPTEMTVADIAKKLGVKNLKIIEG